MQFNTVSTFISNRVGTKNLHLDFLNFILLRNLLCNYFEGIKFTKFYRDGFKKYNYHNFM